jgi:hypothetical protein
MVRLYEDACRQLLAVPPARREDWLQAQIAAAPKATALLSPVAARFRGQVVDDVDGALAWCRQFVVGLTGENEGEIGLTG